MNENTYPRISVVVPTCDRPSLLKETLDSIFEQSVQPYEVIVVDNGKLFINPNDYCSKINYLKGLPKFGVSQARNFGALKATGDYIAFLDDDDKWGEDYIKIITEDIMTSNPDILLTSLYDMSTKNIVASKSIDIKNLKDFKNQLLLRNPGAVGSNTIIKKDLFYTSSGYDPYLTTNQDKALVLDFVLQMNIIIVRSKAKIFFRQDKNITRQTEIKKRIMGKKRFLIKYKKHMTLAIRIKVILQLVKLRVKALMKVRI